MCDRLGQSQDGKPRPEIMKFVSRLVKQSRLETKTVIVKFVSRLVKQSRDGKPIQ